jgi:uncharacterized protein YrzB (UPF0473 family)
MNETPDVIILSNDQGERVGFQPIATVPYQDNTYMILQPVTPMEGVDEGDAFVFLLSQVEGDQSEDSGSFLSMVTDDAVIDGVFDLYNKSLTQN